MSFRIKSSHPLLKQAGEQPQEAPPASYTSLLTTPDGKSSFLSGSLYTPLTSASVSAQAAQENNRPKTASDKGMAIRTVAVGMPDRM